MSDNCVGLPVHAREGGSDPGNLKTPLEIIPELHVSSFAHLAKYASVGRPLVFRPRSHSPDIMVVYRSKTASQTTHNILAIQVKSGIEQDINDTIMLRELALCPLTSKDEGYDYCKVNFNNQPFGSSHQFTLTFALAAINCDALLSRLKANKSKLVTNSSAANGYLKCMHKSWEVIPEHVEVLILTQAGLVELLGQDNYDFLQTYHSARLPEVQAENYLNISSVSHSFCSNSQPSLDEDALRYAVRGVSEASKDRIIAELRQHFKELSQEYQITTNSPENEFLAELSLSPIRPSVSDKKRALEGDSDVQPSKKKFKASASAPNETTSDSELEQKALSQKRRCK